MGWFLAVIRVLMVIVVYAVFAVIGVILFLIFPVSEIRHRRAITWFTRLWGRCSCWIFNIRVRVVGNLQIPDGSMVVGNHVGTPDIFVLASCFRAFFVSKAELSKWPFMSWLTRLGATIFVDRSRRQQVRQTVTQIEDRLREGHSVVIFPEGQATDGKDIWPFKTSHFESAIRADRPVVPVAIRYHDSNTPSIACWYDINFLQHIVALLKNHRLEVTVAVLPEIRGETDRRRLAEKAHDLIREKHQSLSFGQAP